VFSSRFSQRAFCVTELKRTAKLSRPWCPSSLKMHSTLSTALLLLTFPMISNASKLGNKAIVNIGELSEESFVEKIFSAWIKLLPSTATCGVAILGCDLCHHFLANYNLTLEVKVCQGACLSGIIGSCSNVLVNSVASQLVS